MFTGLVTDATTTGRKTTPPSRERIFAAAKDLFERDGFAETGVREIAAAAGLAPALVIRYFGSKEQLFLATMDLDNGLTQVLAGPMKTLGAALADFVMSAAQPDLLGRGAFGALMRASDRPAVRASLQQSLEVSVVGPLRKRLRGPNADLRARLVSACVTGLFSSLELIGDEKLRTADHQTVVDLYGSCIQRLLDD
jgi:AcrR family transcriptional regulator